MIDYYNRMIPFLFRFYRGANDGSDSEDDGPSVDFSQVYHANYCRNRFFITFFTQLSVNLAALRLLDNVKGLAVMPIEENKHLKARNPEQLITANPFCNFIRSLAGSSTSLAHPT